MIKYQYEYDQLLGTVSRVNPIALPSIDSIDTVITAGLPIPNLLEAIRAIYRAQAEGPLLVLENRWYDAQNMLQTTAAAITLVNKHINGYILDVTGTQIPLTDIEKFDINITVNTMLSETQISLVADLLVYLDNKLLKDIDARDTIELGDNAWLQTYRGVTTTTQRPTVTAIIPKPVLKKLVRVVRDKNVRSSEDSIADLAKMNSLLFSMVSSIYGTLSATAKSKIPVAEKGLIDYAITTFSTVQTRADRQLLTEGTALIDKLFKRETDIADIVDVMMKQ